MYDIHRFSYNFIYGGVVVNRDYQKNVTIRTYYNGGKMLRIFYLVDMDVDDGVLHEEIIYRAW